MRRLESKRMHDTREIYGSVIKSTGYVREARVLSFIIKGSLSSRIGEVASSRSIEIVCKSSFLGLTNASVTGDTNLRVPVLHCVFSKVPKSKDQSELRKNTIQIEKVQFSMIL